MSNELALAGGLRLPGSRITLSRDYVGEVRALIEEMTAGEESWVAGIVAAKLAARLREQDPELLQGWLDQGAEGFLRQAITAMDGSRRTHNRVTATRTKMRSAVVASEAGDQSLLCEFLDDVYEMSDGSRRRLRFMNEDDLRYTAFQYYKRASQNAMVAKFLEAIAAKVGQDKVEDHFSEDQLAAMWGSLSSL